MGKKGVEYRKISNFEFRMANSKGRFDDVKVLWDERWFRGIGAREEGETAREYARPTEYGNEVELVPT